jgi:hypothetical protein
MDEGHGQVKSRSKSNEFMNISEYEDLILDLVDHSSDMTRSDLQAAVSAIVHKIIRECGAGRKGEA